MKKATGIAASDFLKNVDLGDLKSEVDKLDIDGLRIVPVDLSKLSTVLDYVFQKMHMMNWLKLIFAIDTSKLNTKILML